MRFIILYLILLSLFLLNTPTMADELVQVLDKEGRMIITNVPRVSPTAMVTSNNQFTLRRNIRQYRPYVRQSARKYRIDEGLVHAVIMAESGYNPSATSPKGAQGLMQLMPYTARLMGVTNAYNPEQNIDGGVRYLRLMSNRFDGNLDHMLAAYNAGPDAVIKYRGIPPYRETQNYVRIVKKFYGVASTETEIERKPRPIQIRKSNDNKRVEVSNFEEKYNFHQKTDHTGRIIFTNVPPVKR